MNIQIKHVEPTNDKLIDISYNYLKSNCPFYDFMTEERFYRCRASIYLAFDLDDNGLTSHTPCGIIGVRRAMITDADIRELEFYCQPYKLAYYIEFLHFNPVIFDKKNDLLPQLEKGYFDLLGCCLKDKNDGFAVFKKYCPAYNEIAIHDSLIKNHFLIAAEDKKGILTYVKEPKMYRFMK